MPEEVEEDEQESPQPEGQNAAMRKLTHLAGFLNPVVAAPEDTEASDSWSWHRWRRRLLVAAAGYAAFAVFAVALTLLRHGWPDLPWAVTVSLATAAAVPMVLALLWERVRGFNVLGVSVTLAAVSVPVREKLATLVQEQKGSATEDLVKRLVRAIEDPAVELIQVNLLHGDYWWASRLYLLAALADDYTDIRRLVFVEKGAERIYLGMAGPRCVRRRLAIPFPEYQSAYRELVQALIHAVAPGAPPGDEVKYIATAWPAKLPDESKPTDRVSSDKLKEWLRDALVSEPMQWDGQPETSLLLYRILARDDAYVALVNGRTLRKVVNRQQLAVRIAVRSLKHDLALD